MRHYQMEEAEKVIKILKKNPKAFIYFHDSGAFTIYKSRKAVEKMQTSEEWDEKKDREITLYEGDDNYGDGYLTLWSEVVATLLKIDIDSV